MASSKKCNKCGEELPFNAFLADARNNDGKQGICRVCQSIQKKEQYWNEPEVLRAQKKADYRKHKENRNKANAEWKRNNKSKVNAQVARYNAKWPEKKRAKTLAHNAVRDGTLKPQPCEVCGVQNNIHKHHSDYSKPLEVTWLCQQHHTEAHNGRL